MSRVDWYKRRDELRSGQVFTCEDGSVVRLDRRVPGDGTKWYVEDRFGEDRWSCEDRTIEPGDLMDRIA